MQQLRVGVTAAPPRVVTQLPQPGQKERQRRDIRVVALVREVAQPQADRQLILAAGPHVLQHISQEQPQVRARHRPPGQIRRAQSHPRADRRHRRRDPRRPHRRHGRREHAVPVRRHPPDLQPVPD